MLEELQKKKNYAAVRQPAVVLLARLLLTIGFGAKKTIIKPFFTKNFLPILDKNPQFLYLFLAFLGSVTDKTVYSMTVGKSLANHVAQTPLVHNKVAQYFLHLVLSKELSKVGAIDKRIALNPALAEFLELDALVEEHLFKENLDFLIRSILASVGLLPTPAQVLEFASDDQHLSSLVGAILERMAKGRLTRGETKRRFQDLRRRLF